MINIVKIGGNVIDSSESLDAFLRDFSRLKGHKILVHGGGKEASRLSRAMGMEPRMIDGRRVTDRATLDLVTMVYAGLVNKRIVARLQGIGTDAIGLSGADGNLIPASRRNPEPVDFGYVGDIDPASVDTGFISLLLENGKVPVFCALCHDGKGMMLNCNADTVASSLAIAMSAVAPVRLTFCFEKPGVMTDVNDDSSVIPLVTPESFRDLLAQGRVAGGMIPKLQNALNSVSAGVSEVRICRSEDLSGDGGTVVKNG